MSEGEQTMAGVLEFLREQVKRQREQYKDLQEFQQRQYDDRQALLMAMLEQQRITSEAHKEDGMELFRYRMDPVLDVEPREARLCMTRSQKRVQTRRPCEETQQSVLGSKGEAPGVGVPIALTTKDVIGLGDLELDGQQDAVRETGSLVDGVGEPHGDGESPEPNVGTDSHICVDVTRGQAKETQQSVLGSKGEAPGVGVPIALTTKDVIGLGDLELDGQQDAVRETVSLVDGVGEPHGDGESPEPNVGTDNHICVDVTRGQAKETQQSVLGSKGEVPSVGVPIALTTK